MDDKLPVERLKKYLDFIQSVVFTDLLIFNDHLNPLNYAISVTKEMNWYVAGMLQ